MTPPVLMLDVDGVLIGGTQHRWDRNMREDLGIDPRVLQKEFFEPHWPSVLRGHQDIHQLLREFLRRIQSNVSAEELLAYWHMHDAEVQGDVLASAASWRARTGGRLGVATNQDRTRLQYLQNALGFADVFDVTAASCDLGHAKPDAAYFVAADRRIGRRQNQEVFFLDDSQAHVRAAEEHGWSARHVTSPANASNVIRGLG